MSHPQVFTRERLVEERFRESEWARSQLSDENFKDVHSVNSGLRDLRTFVGVANSLSASISPTSPGGTPDGSSSAAPQHTAISAPTSHLDDAPRESKAQIDAIKEFEFKQAVRNKVNAAIRQVQLDDTHDLRGSTLYSLQFLITVEPGRNTSEYAVVELRARPPDSEFCNGGIRDRTFQTLYARWKTALSEDPRISGAAPANRAAIEIVDDESTFWNRLCQPYYDSYGSDRDDFYVAYVEPAEYAQKVSDVLANEDFSRYVTSLQGMLPNTPVTASETLEVVNQATELAHAATLQPLVVGVTNGRDRFGWIIGPRFSVEDGKATWKHVPTQYYVSVAISVPAWWPNLMIDGRVGWRARDGTTSWNRAPWYRSPVLSGLREGTEADKSIEVRDGDSRVDADGRDSLYFVMPRAPLWGQPLKVRLPGDMMALTTEILAEDRPSVIRPHIESTEDCQRNLSKGIPCYRLIATACGGELTPPQASAGVDRQRKMPQSLYIRGTELWRNVRVYVGSQRADRVDILPDMRGIVAYFDEVVFVPDVSTRSSRQEIQDLRVVTSVSEDRLRKAVAITTSKPCPSGHQISLTAPGIR